jgi:hypothetical protein
MPQMSTASANVRVAVTGEVSMGLTSATAPTGTGGTITGFTGLGYVSEDGVKETRDRSTNDIKAWQNGDTVRTVVTDSSLKYQLTLIETKKETVELYYGATVTQAASDGSWVIVPSATGGRRSFVIDVVDGSNLLRIYIPQGEVTEVGEVTYSNGDPIGYEVTITAYPDATTGGNAKVWNTALKTP